jgi:hypothetical protein
MTVGLVFLRLKLLFNRLKTNFFVNYDGGSRCGDDATRQKASLIGDF